MRLAVLEKGHGLLSKGFSGPLRVLYSLCCEWERMEEIELLILANTFISLLQSRFEPQFPFIRRLLLENRVRTCRFDVLNIHGVSRNNLGVMKVCKKRRIPVVYTAHGLACKERYMGYQYSDEFINQEKTIISLSDKIVAVSASLKDQLVDTFRLPEEKLKVIYNGVDPNFGKKNYRHFDVHKKHGIPNNRKILINVGGTLRIKGIPFLVRSLQLLKRNDWHLVLIGPKGVDHESIIRLCSSKLCDHFTFTGILGEDELLNYYHSADLFIAASEHEGFMLSALEALSCGTDVVMRATIPEAQRYFCNLPEMTENNIFETPEELSSIVTNYLLGRQKIKKSLSQEIVQFHSWQKRAREYLQVFMQFAQ
jgi:glycosyltransferase involved in cell wall biosynthesis